MKFVLCLTSPLSVYKCRGQCWLVEASRLCWVLFLYFFPLSFSFLQPIIKTTAEIKFSMISVKPCKSSGSPFQVKKGLHLSLSPKADCRTQGEQGGFSLLWWFVLFSAWFVFFLILFFFHPEMLITQNGNFSLHFPSCSQVSSQVDIAISN